VEWAWPLQDMGMLAKTPERWTSCLVSWGRNPRKDCITARGKEKKVRDEEIKLKLLRLTLLHGQLHTNKLLSEDLIEFEMEFVTCTYTSSRNRAYT